MNIILIISDTFRRDHLGCYGNEWIRTPHIDKFARESVVFENAYAGSFPTVPHRADVVTGRFSFPFYGWGRLPQKEVVLAQILKQAGYRGACTTKRGLIELNKDVYQLKRVKVTNSDMTSPFNFWAKLSGYYNLFRSKKEGH